MLIVKQLHLTGSMKINPSRQHPSMTKISEGSTSWRQPIRWQLASSRPSSGKSSPLSDLEGHVILGLSIGDNRSAVLMFSRLARRSGEQIVPQPLLLRWSVLTTSSKPPTISSRRIWWLTPSTTSRTSSEECERIRELQRPRLISFGQV